MRAFVSFKEFYESFTDPIQTNHICCMKLLEHRKKCYLQKHSGEEKKKKNKCSYYRLFYSVLY